MAIEGLPVVFCLDRAGLVGEDGATHHGAFDLSYLRSIPGMTVASPRNQNYLRDLMLTASVFDGPFAIRYPRGRGETVEERPMATLRVGQGEKLHDGDDLVVLSIGPVASEVERAIARAERDFGITVAHYDMMFLKPIDQEILKEVASKNVPVITVEDGTVDGGLGSAVLEWMADHNYFLSVTRKGVPDRFIPQGSPAEGFATLTKKVSTTASSQSVNQTLSLYEDNYCRFRRSGDPFGKVALTRRAGYHCG